MELNELGTGATIAIGLLVVLQIGVVIWALVDLFKRPAAQVRWGNKIVWAAVVILLSNSFIGPIVYFAFGRIPAVADENGAQTATDADRTQRAVDSLYGGSDR